MKKIVFTMMLLLMLITSQVHGLTSGGYLRGNQYLGSQNPKLDAFYKHLLDFEDLYNSGTGETFYVDSGVSNEGDGTSWDRAKDTLDEAINLCTVSRGDVILVAPGHAETIAAANGWDADVNGISIKGLGNGDDRPTFTLTAAGSTVAIGADNVSISGLRFVAGVSAIVTAISVEAAGDYFTMTGCEFVSPATSTYEFYDMVKLATGADYVTISGNKFVSTVSTTGCNQAIDVDTGIVNRLTVVGNEFQGAFVVAAIHSDKVNTNCLIGWNDLYQATSGEFAIEFTEATTGLCIGNNIYTNSASTALDPGSMICIENYVAATINSSAVLVPAALANTSIATILASIGGQDANSAALIAWTLIQDANIALILEDTATTLPGLIGDVNTNIAAFAVDANTNTATLIGDVNTNAQADLDAIVAQGLTSDANQAQLEVAALPSKGHPNYFTVDANMTSVTWDTVAAHRIAVVTGNVRMTIMAECTHEDLVSAGTNATIVLGVAGNTSAIWASAAVDSWDLGEVASAVYAAAPTFPLGVGDAQSALTHVLMDVVVMGGLDVGYTLGTSAGTLGTIRWHVWWTPLSSTGLVTAGDGTGF